MDRLSWLIRAVGRVKTKNKDKDNLGLPLGHF